MRQWSHGSYPQGNATRQNSFVSCIDIRMDERIVLLVGGTAPEEKERKMMFFKITNNRYVSFDGKFEIVKVGFGVWSVSKKNDNDKFFSLYFNHSFESASNAIAELEKAVA
jgi:hypothetical protein